MLDTLKSAKKAIGIKQSVKAVENNSVDTVFIAADADERVVAKLKELCEENSIDVVITESMKALGKACGIEVGAAAACLLKEDV